MPSHTPPTDAERTRRFRDAALPHLDAVYTLARHLLRNPADAEDAVQECYLRAFKHFDGLHGASIKPWLLAILRNVCHAEFARRSGNALTSVEDIDEASGRAPLWQEAQDTPETQLLRRRDATTIRKLLAALADPFREIIVLREIQNLSYREIADIVGAPIGTVMSRLARARTMLRTAWIAEEEQVK